MHGARRPLRAAGLAAAALLLSAQSGAGWAQAAPAAAARPKVCLVLSGGGARGAAHVGVLKVLDELRIPIDCIAGTSMGSIVGAAYASGTPLEQLQATLDSTSTRLLFKELPPRDELSLHIKRDDALNLAGPEMGLRAEGLQLPKGLVSGVQLETVLRSLTRVHGFRRFDELPIPFRAVATDLVSGKPVVLSEGDLVGAMRASMSVPAAVEPARLGGRVLVDGGLTNNLPIDVARAMGADIVIAVNLGTPLAKPEALTSIVGVTGQMVNILTQQNVEVSLASLKPTDILILPQLGDYPASDFDHMPVIVPMGESATRAVSDLLARLSVPEPAYQAWRQRRLAGTPPDVAPVDEIRFEPMQRVNPEIVRSVMQTRVGEPLDPQELDQDMRRIFGTGDFEHVSYRLIEEPGRRVLSVDAAEKSYGPTYLRLGLTLSTDFRGDAFFNLLGSLRMTWLNSLGGEWRSDVQIGRDNRLSTEFYQPLEASQTFFVVPRASHDRRSFDVYQAVDRIARYDIRRGQLAVEVGAQFTKYGEVRLGLLRSDERAVLDTGSDLLLPSQGRATYTSVTLDALVDQLDSVNFPRAGYAATLKLQAVRKALGGDADFTRAEVVGNYVKSFGEHSFNFGVKYGGRVGGDPLPAEQYFQWGGLMQQSGYPTGALLGEELRFARLLYYKRLARGSLLEGVYGGVSLEVGQVLRPLVPGNEQGTLRSAALLLAADTPVGPLNLGWGRVDRGYSSWYLFLGRP